MQFMKTLSKLALIATAIVAGTFAMPAQEFPVNAQLTIQQQNPYKFSQKTGTYTDTIKTTRLTANYLLNLLQPFYTVEAPNGFPARSRLVLVNFNHFEVHSPSGTVIVADTWPYLTYSDTFSQTNYLFQGKENVNTDALNHIYFYHSTIQFNDPSPEGTSFTFTGNALEKYNRGPRNSRNEHPANGLLSINGFGSGRINGQYFHISGKFSTPLVRWVETGD